MKVHELIEALKALPDQNAEVISAIDDEGNGYRGVTGVDTGTVEPGQNLWMIDSYHSDEHTDEECCLEPGERDDFDKVICIW